MPSTSIKGNLPSMSSSIGIASNTQAKAILETRCLSCHGAGGLGGISNINDLPSLVSRGLIVPGDPNQSPLIQSVESGRMPVGGSLSLQELATLRNWVANYSTAGSSPGGSTGGPTIGSTPTPSPTSTPSAQASPTPTPPPLTASYSAIQANILTPRCVSCHGSGLSGGGYRYDSYAATKLSVKPFDANNSKLYTEVFTGKMPKGTAKLTASEIQMIANWINAGAPNN